MASLRKRGSNFYVSYYAGGKERRLSLDTDNIQLAKEKLRQFESAQLRGDDSPLPTRTPIAQVVQAYVEHIRTHKTAKSAQTDVYYLREAFGAICPGLEVTSRKLSAKARKRPLLPGAVQDLRRRAIVIEAPCFEQISEMLEDTIRAFRAQRISDAEYLQQVSEISESVRDRSGDNLPAELRQYEVAKAFYGVVLLSVGQVASDQEQAKKVSTEAAIGIDEIITKHRIVNWSTNADVQNRIRSRTHRKQRRELVHSQAHRRRTGRPR